MIRLLLLVFLIGTSMNASAEDQSLLSIIQAITNDAPFDVSPRYVNFRPSEKLRVEIEKYCMEATDGKLLELENALWDTKNAYVAIGLISILASYDNPHSSEVIKRYNRYLSQETRLFTSGYPDKKAVISNLSAIKKAQ